MLPYLSEVLGPLSVSSDPAGFTKASPVNTVDIFCDFKQPLDQADKGRTVAWVTVTFFHQWCKKLDPGSCGLEAAWVVHPTFVVPHSVRQNKH